jgi:RNA polymerase sigma factor (sigma-70 family)
MDSIVGIAEKPEDAVPRDVVIDWLNQLTAGEAAAAQRLWERYFGQLVRLAIKRLGDLPRRDFDEEDVALSAMRSFFSGVAANRFPRLEDENDLWRLLVTITARKAAAQAKRLGRQKRGGGKVRGESAWSKPEASLGAGIEQVMGTEPTPEFAAMVAEDYRRLLGELDDKSLYLVACHRMEGYTNEEVAEKLGVTVRTVERKLARIRRRWRAAVGC